MTLEDVLAKSEIIFPRFLNLDEMNGLLEYYNTKGKIAVRYQLTMQHDLGIPLPPSKTEDPLDLRNFYLLTLSGRITSLQDHYALDSFEVLGQHEQGIKGLRFQLIPGYELNEYRPEVVALWNKVKTLTEKYFKSEK